MKMEIIYMKSAWLVRWLKRFGIDFDCRGSYFLSFLIESVYEEHLARWEAILHLLELEATEHKSRGRYYIPFFAFMSHTIFERHVRNQIEKGKGKYRSEVMGELLKGIIGNRGRLAEMLKGEREIEWVIMNSRYIPDWYNLVNIYKKYSFLETIEKKTFRDFVGEFGSIDRMTRIINDVAKNAQAIGVIEALERVEKSLQEEIETRRKSLDLVELSEYKKLQRGIKYHIEDAIQHLGFVSDNIEDILEQLDPDDKTILLNNLDALSEQLNKTLKFCVS